MINVITISRESAGKDFLINVSKILDLLGELEILICSGVEFLIF